MGSGFRHLRYKKREDDSISRTNDRLAASILDMKKVSLVVQQEKHWIKRERRGDSVSRLSPCAGFPTLGNLPPGRKVPSEAGDPNQRVSPSLRQDPLESLSFVSTDPKRSI